MWLPILMLTPAWADSPADRWAIEPGGFELRRGGAQLKVRAIGLPSGTIDPKFRTCKVTLDWAGGPKGKAALTLRDCHPNLADSVTEALARWDWELSSPPGRDRELLELWYVFPEDDTESMRVFVRQAVGQELTLRADLFPEGAEVDVLEWSVKSRRPLEFPDAAEQQADLSITDCEVKIDIAASGVPGVISITHCDEIFHEQLESQLRGWRFGTPELGGVPFYSGVTLGVHYARALEAGDTSTVRIELPPDPDMGPTRVARNLLATEELAEPPPLPNHPPLFTVNHKSYAEVRVYEMIWPEPPASERERTCDVLWGVNSKRRVWAWTEGCDETLRDPVEQAANRWVLSPGRIEKGEWYARFRGTMVFPAGGAPPILRVPAGDLVTEDLPPQVQSFSVARTLHTVAPTLPRAFATEVTDSQVLCDFDVQVDKRGRPVEIATNRCPGGYEPIASAALRRWRWIPAEADGTPVASRVRVRIRFES